MDTSDSDSFIRSFARGLCVIEVLGKDRVTHTVGSVAAATELPRTVVRRILMTLVALGYAASDGKEFRLTPRILNLGMTYLTSLPFWGFAQGVMEELCNAVRESVALAVFDSNEVTYILRIPSRKVMSLQLGMGSRVPAYATSPGRVMLVALDASVLRRYLSSTNFKAYTPKTVTSKASLRDALVQVAESGYAWVDGEFDRSVCGISVPVYDSSGHAVAALSVNFLSGEMTRSRAVKQILPALRHAAEQLRAMAPKFLSPMVPSGGVPD